MDKQRNKAGEGRYEVKRNSGRGEVLYGCPRITKWRYPTCDHKWVEWAIGNEEIYCSDCGSRGIIENSVDSFNGKNDVWGNPIDI